VGDHPVWVVHGRDRAVTRSDFLAALAPFGALAAGATVALYFLTIRLREAADQAAAARLEADAQRAIAGLADRLNLALRSARAGAWEWVPGEPAGTWSPENFDVFGVDPTGGTPAFDQWVASLVVPEDRDAFRQAVGDALTGPLDTFSFEFRITHPTRGVRWISSPGRIERDGDGTVTRLIGLNLDITTERTAVEALRRSEERFRLLFEANPNPMWIYDRQTLRFLSVNRAAIERYGYSEAEFLSMSIADIRPPEDMPQLQKVIDAMAPRAAAAGTWRHLSKAGETIYADVTAQPVDFNGRQAVSIVVHDVTDRRRAEEALKDSEARFRTMADHAPMMVWTTDASGHCDFVGASWSDFTGLPADAGLGTGRLDAVHPDDRTALAAVLTAPATRSAGFVAEYRLRHHADGWRWVMDAAAPRTDGDGRFLGLIGSIVDIARRKAAEDGIQTLLREVNHRSKNLLAVVQAIARTTAASDPEDFVPRFSERLQALAASQDLLVDNLWQGVDLFDLLRAQLGHWRSAIGRRILATGPPLRLSAAAAQTLGMAIYELGTNAGKYGALSGDSGTVAVDWSVREDDPRGARVLMTWVETGGPPVTPPERRGFGSTVVERLVRKGLDADVVLTFAPDGLRWSLDASAGSVLDTNRPS
jgi:PAS domain S-box-containing protein